MCSRHIGHVIAVDRFSVSGSKAVKWRIAGDGREWVGDAVRGGRGGGEGCTVTRFAVGVDMAVAAGRESFEGDPSLFHASIAGIAGQFCFEKSGKTKFLRGMMIITVL